MIFDLSRSSHSNFSETTGFVFSSKVSKESHTVVKEGSIERTGLLVFETELLSFENSKKRHLFYFSRYSNSHYFCSRGSFLSIKVSMERIFIRVEDLFENSLNLILHQKQNSPKNPRRDFNFS